MKKLFWTGMIFYLVGCSIFIILLILFGVFLFVGLFSGIWSNDVDKLVPLFIMVVGFTIYMFIILGYFYFQYVVIDEEKIVAKNLFGKMREITWEEVREVRIEKVMYDPREKPIGWLIFIEKKDPNRRYIGGGMTKKSCIKIRYKPENEEFLRQCHPEVKFVNYIDDE